MEEQEKTANTVKDDSAQNQPSDKQTDAEPQVTSESGSSDKTPDPKKDGEYVFEGNWGELEEKAPNMVKYAKGVRKYLTKESERTARDKEKIDKYTQLEKDPELSEFIEWKKAKRLGYAQPAYGTGQVPAELSPTDPEYIDPDVQRLITEKERVVTQKLNTIEQQLAQFRQEKELEAFADAHPHFWELNRLGLIAPQLEKVRRTGGTTMDAYNVAMDNYNNLVKALKQEQTAKVTKKQNASSAKPTSGGEPDVEYVNNPKDLMQRAFDLAKKGEVKKLKIKKSK